MWGICALSRSGFCCVKRLFKRRRMGETIDTAALRLVLCGLIQGKCYLSGTAQFQPQFSNLASSYFSFLCFYVYIRMAATQQLPAPWFNSIFPPVLKGNEHLRRGIQFFVPQTSQFIQKAPNSNASLQTSIMRDLCPL